MREKTKSDLVKMSRKAWYMAYGGIGVMTIILIAIAMRQPPAYLSRDGFLMGTYVRVVVHSSKDPYMIMDAIFRELKRIEAKFDPYREGSEIYAINKNGATLTDIDQETRFVIERSLSIARATNGAYDPALGRIIQLWGFERISDSSFQPRVPTQQEIADVLHSSGYYHVEITSMGIRLLESAQLDLGGIVKGYAIDRSIQVARALDPKVNGYIDAGGDIGFLGAKFGTADWLVGIQNPRPGSPEDDTPIHILYLREGAVATSGDYQRYFMVDAKRYHHVINPFTGTPVDGVISSTVIANTAMDADALSTAAMVLGSEIAVHTIPQLGGQVFLISEQGVHRYSTGFSHFLNPR